MVFVGTGLAGACWIKSRFFMEFELAAPFEVAAPGLACDISRLFISKELAVLIGGLSSRTVSTLSA